MSSITPINITKLPAETCIVRCSVACEHVDTGTEKVIHVNVAFPCEEDHDWFFSELPDAVADYVSAKEKDMYYATNIEPSHIIKNRRDKRIQVHFITDEDEEIASNYRIKKQKYGPNHAYRPGCKC